MRRPTASCFLTLCRCPGCSKLQKLWANFRTQLKLEESPILLTGTCLEEAHPPLDWSHALTGAGKSPLALSAAKAPSLLPGGSSPPDWCELLHGQISKWNPAIQQSAGCPRFCMVPVSGCEVDQDKKGIALHSCSTAGGDPREAN